MLPKKSLAILAFTALGLVLLVGVALRPYGGNVSALLHMDVPFGGQHHVPSGLVLYEDAAYDGMLYYQIARDLPALFTAGTPSLDSPYRFQRILLPLLAFLVTFGREGAFPAALLSINLFAALVTLALTLSLTKGRTLHALTIVLNPAMLVGILFSLTEPLSLLFLLLFFFQWERQQRTMDGVAAGALLLSLMARETTVFLIGLLFLWYLWRRRWRDALFAVLPLLPFVAWQYYLILQLGDVPFQANSNIVSIPLSGPLQVFWWLIEGKKVTYLLSSIGLMLFVFPLCCTLGKEWLKKRRHIDVLAFLLGGLCATMLTMDAHMWGAITSIGRVVTPLYPVYALYAAERDTRLERLLSLTLVIISIVAAVGIASVRHPFILS